jgi:hypothetical protein
VALRPLGVNAENTPINLSECRFLNFVPAVQTLKKVLIGLSEWRLGPARRWSSARPRHQGAACAEPIDAGVQGYDNPQVSVLTFSVFGGVTLPGDPEAPDIQTSKIGVLTPPQGFLIEVGGSQAAAGTAV